jgi:hypothetical protein
VKPAAVQIDRPMNQHYIRWFRAWGSSVEFKRIKETTQMWSLNIRSHGDRFCPLPVH